MLPTPVPTPRHDSKISALHKVGRANDAIQIIVWGTFGQFLLTDKFGEVQLRAPQWREFADWIGGQQAAGWSVLAAAILGLLGLFSLAWTKSDNTYTALMWVFSVYVALWCFTVAGFQTHAMIVHDAGNAGFWNWSLVGCYFLFSRLAITLSRGLK